MNIRIPSSTQIPPVNTADIHNHRAIKNENLQRLAQEKAAERNQIKLEDYKINCTDLHDWEDRKNIDQINLYLNIKRSTEYALYQYSKYLGRHVDVYV